MRKSGNAGPNHCNGPATRRARNGAQFVHFRARSRIVAVKAWSVTARLIRFPVPEPPPVLPSFSLGPLTQWAARKMMRANLSPCSFRTLTSCQSVAPGEMWREPPLNPTPTPSPPARFPHRRHRRGGAARRGD
jgi:hypothetical protein